MSDVPTGGQNEQSKTEPTQPAKQAGTSSSKGMNKNIIMAVAAVLLIGGGLYYKSNSDDSKKEKAAEAFVESLTGNKYDLDADSNSIEYTDKDTGESTTIESNQKLPSDFPKDSIPYLDEKSVTLVVSSTEEGKKNWSVTTSVDESLADAVAFFTGEIVEPYYTNISTYSYNDTTTFSAKTDTYGVYINVSKYTSDSDTTVSYVISQE